jgi:hypothetical protein
VLIVDKLLFGGPIAGVRWILGQLQTVVEKELTSEEPIMQAILENEMALEEGRVDKAAYEETQAALMAQLREVKELKKRLAEEKAGIASAPPAADAKATGPIIGGKKVEGGKASIEVDLDFGGWGKDSGKK